METPRRPLAVRQGVAVGLLVLAVLTPGIVAHSSTPFLALIETLAVGMIAVVGASAVAVAINRRRTRPAEPRRSPP